MSIDISDVKCDDMEIEVQYESSVVRYRVPVCEECRGWDIPGDINRFITLIYPNMRAKLQSRLGAIGVVDEIINTYVLYSLEVGERGVKRYMLYDSGRGIEFFKWFLFNLRYTRLSYKSKLKDESRFVSIEDTIDVEAGTKKTVRADTVAIEANDQEEYVYFGELEDFIQMYGVIHCGEVGIRGLILDFFKCRVYGFRQKEICDQLKIGRNLFKELDMRLRNVVRQFDSNVIVD